MPERWAFLATLGIWLGTSLPVYMVLNPSWSHAQSAFTVALFFWYWNRTREARTWPQWAALGALGGLAMDVYYLNVVLLALPLMESAWLWMATPESASLGKRDLRPLFARTMQLFAAAALTCFLSDTDRKENYLRKLFEFRLYGALVLEFSGAAARVLFAGPWTLQLDAHRAAGCRGHFPAAEVRSAVGAVLGGRYSSDIFIWSGATRIGMGFRRSAADFLYRSRRYLSSVWLHSLILSGAPGRAATLALSPP